MGGSSPIIWGPNGTAINLEAGLGFSGETGPSILTGTVDPTSVATNGVKGSLYLNSSTAAQYKKQDNGSTTNWLPLIGTTGNVAPNIISYLSGSGTYVPSANTAYFKVLVLGGGGGGGGTSGTAVNAQVAGGGGGGGGAALIKTINSPSGSYSYSIGAGGSGGSAGVGAANGGTGGNGGDTTFGSLLAPGGNGGTGSPYLYLSFEAQGGQASFPVTGGDLNFPGSAGTPGGPATSGITNGSAGVGGAGGFGGGGVNAITNATATNAPANSGGGGSGGSTQSTPGGSGGSGMLLIYEYAAPSGASGGGITRVISSISANTSALAAANTDYVYDVSGTTTLTLPTAVSNTNRYTVKNVGTNTVTVAFTGGQTADGSSTVTLPIANMSLDFVSNNSNWTIE